MKKIIISLIALVATAFAVLFFYFDYTKKQHTALYTPEYCSINAETVIVNGKTVSAAEIIAERYDEEKLMQAFAEITDDIQVDLTKYFVQYRTKSLSYIDENDFNGDMFAEEPPTIYLPVFNNENEILGNVEIRYNSDNKEYYAKYSADESFLPDIYKLMELFSDEENEFYLISNRFNFIHDYDKLLLVKTADGYKVCDFQHIATDGAAGETDIYTATEYLSICAELEGNQPFDDIAFSIFFPIFLGVSLFLVATIVAVTVIAVKCKKKKRKEI